MTPTVGPVPGPPAPEEAELLHQDLSDAEATFPAPGAVLAGRYRLAGLVGRGGVGEVWAADDLRLDRRVAVKLLRPEMGAQPAVRRRFEAEARAAAGLSHPHAVAVFDAGEDRGRAYLVMECLPGHSLSDAMRRGPLDPATVRTMAVQVLGALDVAHRRGLVHRDIKPANILCDEDGAWKLADFGIAKSVTAELDLTTTGMLVGTPAYLAPERIDGEPAGPASDQFSLGVVLYEALAGRKPFRGPDAVALAAAVRSAAPEPLADLPGIPGDLAAAVNRALAKRPEDRFVSAAAMARALSAAPGPPGTDPTVTMDVPGAQPEPTVVGAPVAAAPVAAAPRAATGRSARRTWIAAVAAIVLIVALAVAAGHHGGAPPAGPATATTTTAPAADTSGQGPGATTAGSTGGSGGGSTGAGSTGSGATVPAPLDRTLGRLGKLVKP